MGERTSIKRRAALKAWRTRRVNAHYAQSWATLQQRLYGEVADRLTVDQILKKVGRL
jgi:hypothetical protein